MPINKIRVQGAETSTDGEWTSFHVDKDTGGGPHLISHLDSVIRVRRMPVVVKIPLTGASIHSAVQSWVNPEPGNIIITKAIVDVTTVATGACRLDIGTTATSATTASDNLIDGIDVNGATGLLGQADGDGTTNSKLQQKLATAKWVTIKEISGDATGLVGFLYITYHDV